MSSRLEIVWKISFEGNTNTIISISFANLSTIEVFKNICISFFTLLMTPAGTPVVTPIVTKLTSAVSHGHTSLFATAPNKNWACKKKLYLIIASHRLYLNGKIFSATVNWESERGQFAKLGWKRMFEVIVNGRSRKSILDGLLKVESDEGG